MYQIRRAKDGDLPEIKEIYAYARSFMARTGNPNQWGQKNPPPEQLVEDIREGKLYVVTEAGQIHGVFFFSLGSDPTYNYIEDGQWHSHMPYGTIHRIASDGSGGVFGAALDFCRKRSSYLRIDTHEDNKIMQHVVQKHGFRRCGIIYVADGSPRIAYDRTE